MLREGYLRTLLQQILSPSLIEAPNETLDQPVLVLRTRSLLKTKVL